MRQDLRALVPIALLIAAALGCRADTSGLSTLEIAAAEAMVAGGGAVFCDANSADTRARHGTIPGAVLLSGYDTYDTRSEVPPETDLVFYCHSEMCGAAASAARRAIAAGHRRVFVMHAGIKGWVAAGKPVDRPAEG